MNISRILSDPNVFLSEASGMEILIAAIAIIIGTVVLLGIFVAGKKAVSYKKGDLGLILGPCGAGKTSLFYRWSLPETAIKTVTSQAPMRGRVLKGSSIEIVDFPGHPRLRHGALSLLPRSQKIVFLLDSTSKDLKVAAEQLFDVFVSKELRTDAKLLICRNKVDLRNSKSESVLLGELNDEFEKLRGSRAQQLDGDSAHDQYLGVADEPFDIKVHCPIDVEFGSISVAKGDLNDVEAFLVD
jgi:signal recognition particle receptor subunit beta